MRVTKRVAPGPYSTSTPLMLLPGTFGGSWVDEVTLAFFDFGAFARTLPNGRVATSSEQRIRFVGPSSPRSTQATGGAGPHCRLMGREARLVILLTHDPHRLPRLGYSKGVNLRDVVIALSWLHGVTTSPPIGRKPRRPGPRRPGSPCSRARRGRGSSSPPPPPWARHRNWPWACRAGWWGYP